MKSTDLSVDTIKTLDDVISNLVRLRENQLKRKVEEEPSILDILPTFITTPPKEYPNEANYFRFSIEKSLDVFATFFKVLNYLGKESQAEAYLQAIHLVEDVIIPKWYNAPLHLKDGSVEKYWVENGALSYDPKLTKDPHTICNVWWSKEKGEWVTPTFPIAGRRVCPITPVPYEREKLAPKLQALKQEKGQVWS